MSARLLVVLLLAACLSEGDAATTISIKTATQARQAVGKTIRFTGTAQNAKLSAVVQTTDFLLYCLDRREWPSSVVGKTVTVEGKLEYSDEFQATTSPEGEVSAGTSGKVFLLRKSSYRIRY